MESSVSHRRDSRIGSGRRVPDSARNSGRTDSLITHHFQTPQPAIEQRLCCCHTIGNHYYHPNLFNDLNINQSYVISMLCLSPMEKHCYVSNISAAGFYIVMYYTMQQKILIFFFSHQTDCFLFLAI